MNSEALKSFLKRYGVVAASAVVIVGSIVFYVLHLDAIDRLDASYKKLSRDQVNLFNDVKNGNGLEEDLASLTSMLETVEQRLFQPSDLAKNYSYFYQIESKTKVKLSDLRQYVDAGSAAAGGEKGQAQDAKPTFTRIGYEAKVEGRIEQVIDFLKHLEGGESFYRINNLSIKGSSKVDPNLVELQIAFWMLGNPA